jgi:diadenosine tetraphosphatase ApaH/serine/threonine PP2A family protein phosphatase
MKIAVLGDIHSNLEALTAVLEETERLGCEKYVCIGDIVGYNANPKECIEIVRSLDLLGVVMGNHDSYTSNSQELIGFNLQAAQAVEWTRKQLSEEELQWLGELPLKRDIFLTSPSARFSIVHSTMDNPGMWGYIFDRYTAAASMQYQWTPLCFFGHTHTPLAFDKTDEIEGGLYESLQILPNHKYLINVGSVGQPRDRDPRAAFAIYDVEASAVSLHRVEYDIEESQRKILAAGLPERLAERLSYGR